MNSLPTRNEMQHSRGINMAQRFVRGIQSSKSWKYQECVILVRRVLGIFRIAK